MSRNRPVGRNELGPVALPQTGANIGVQREIERAYVAPESLDLLREAVRRHVVPGTPQRTHVGDAELARAGIGELDVPSIARTERSADTVPSLPDVEEFLGVAALGHDLGQRIDLETLLPLTLFGCPSSPAAARDNTSPFPYSASIPVVSLASSAA